MGGPGASNRNRGRPPGGLPRPPPSAGPPGAKRWGGWMTSAELLRRYKAGERDLHAAVLKRAQLARAHLAEVDLSGADLRGACLAGACLRGVALRQALLGGADLSGA